MASPGSLAAPLAQRGSSDLQVVTGLLLVTVSCCLLLYLFPYRATALVSLALMFAISLWRWDLALAFQINGFMLVAFTWSHIGITGLGLVAPSLIVGAGLAFYMLQNRPLFTRSSLYLGILILLPLMTFSLLYSADQSYGMRRVVQYAVINLVSFSVVFLTSDLQLLRRLLKAILGFGLIIAAIALADQLFFSGSSGARYELFGVNPIWFGRGIGLTVVVLLALSSAAEHPLRHLMRWLLLIPLFYVLVSAGSRGPLFSCGITVVVYLWWQLAHRSLALKLGAIALLGAAALLLIGQFADTAIATRISTVQASGRDISALYRIAAAGLALELFARNIWLGVGAGGFNAFHFIKYPHNLILEFMCEYGLLGLTLLLVLATATVRLIRRAARLVKLVPEAKPIYRAFVLILLYAFLNAQFSGALTGNNWLWLGMGGLLALTAILEHKSPPTRG